jgi:hypothetical protein
MDLRWTYAFVELSSVFVCAGVGSALVFRVHADFRLEETVSKMSSCSEAFLQRPSFSAQHLLMPFLIIMSKILFDDNMKDFLPKNVLSSV